MGMGMGCAANLVFTIEPEQIQKVCPKCYKTFMDVLRIENIQLRDYAQAILYNEETPEVIDTAYTWLLKSFKSRTGLEISIDYHDPDNGDIYDDISGAYWLVETEVMEKTPIAKEFEEKFGPIGMKQFVTFE